MILELLATSWIATGNTIIFSLAFCFIYLKAKAEEKSGTRSLLRTPRQGRDKHPLRSPSRNFARFLSIAQA